MPQRMPRRQSYALRRSATHWPEHPRSENCQVPLPCRSKSCPSALAVMPSAPMLTSLSVLGYHDMHNAIIDDPNVTTGDHDGKAVVLCAQG